MPVILILLLLLLPSAGEAGGNRDLRLIDAARQADTAAVEALLGQGVDVNATQGDGATALHWAAHRDDAATVALLIEAGADVNATNELGIPPLMLACTNGSDAMVARLLDAGADPNLRPEGRETALMTAAWTGNLKAVELLLARGALVDATEAERKQTALMWAASERHPQIRSRWSQRAGARDREGADGRGYALVGPGRRSESRGCWVYGAALGGGAVGNRSHHRQHHE
jgi:ankyrin repeat protein